MDKEQAKKLFTKYLNDQCSAQEKELLDNYLDSYQDKGKLWSELEFDGGLREKMWQKIKTETKLSEKKPAISFRKYLKYAAIFIGLLAATFWLKNTKEEVQKILGTKQVITLKTGDSEIKVLDEANSQEIISVSDRVVARQSGDQISYQKNEGIKELIYNEVQIPNGKKFKIVLSDGTFVHLNSGSSFKYPVNFISGKERMVFLFGEAYFEVAEDKEHPFVITTDNMGVRVLGTHFGVSAYKDEKTFTVLAEGSIGVFKPGDRSDLASLKVINPGQKAAISKNEIEVEEVDIANYLAWTTDKLAFNNEPFVEILPRIERKYNVKILNNYDKLNKKMFKGIFEDESITDVLDTFKENTGFNYKIEANEITIYGPDGQ